MWTATSLRRNSTSCMALESSRSRMLKYAVSARLAKRLKSYSCFSILPENRKTSVDWALWCASRGIDNFSKSTCRMSMESYRSAELKYAFFSRTGRKTKKLRRSELFLWTVFKHGLPEGSTILLQYSAITHTPLESLRSWLGELKYAISAGYDVILKNKSIWKCKK